VYGISSNGKDAISKAVEDLFDSLALRILGDMPKLRHKKYLAMSAKPNLNLAHLFVQSMNNRSPNSIERDVLKGMLESSQGYIDTLKGKTKSSVIDRINSLIMEAQAKKETADGRLIHKIINDELSKAKSHLKMIVESEGTKFRNLGTMMNLTRMAASVGDNDPNLFITEPRDKFTCKDCLKNHFLPDGITPRIFKLSEIKQGYLSKADRDAGQVSIHGQHPNCRASVTYLSRGFGFKNGSLAYIAQDYDEYQKQRNPK
jgi:hypothetical protein